MSQVDPTQTFGLRARRAGPIDQVCTWEEYGKGCRTVGSWLRDTRDAHTRACEDVPCVSKPVPGCSNLPRVPSPLDLPAGDRRDNRLGPRKLVATLLGEAIKDYGLADCRIADYFTLPPIPGVEGIVTNPPYKLAERFIQKALTEAPYWHFWSAPTSSWREWVAQRFWRRIRQRGYGTPISASR